MRRLLFPLPLLSALLSSACASSTPPPTSRPADAAPAQPQPQPRLPPMGWTAEDARVLIDGMLAECVKNAAWATAFAGERGRPPAVRVAGVINKTMDHLNGNELTGALEKALTDSGKVQVLPAVGSLAQRAIRDEQHDAAMGLTEGDVEIGKQIAADFVLSLSIGSALERQANDILQTYSATLRIVDSTTGAMACVAMPKSRRLVGPPAASSPATP